MSLGRWKSCSVTLADGCRSSQFSCTLGPVWDDCRLAGVTSKRQSKVISTARHAPAACSHPIPSAVRFLKHLGERGNGRGLTDQPKPGCRFKHRLLCWRMPASTADVSRRLWNPCLYSTTSLGFGHQSLTITVIRQRRDSFVPRPFLFANS